MARKLPASPQDLIDIFRRRKWWILVPIAIIPVLVFAIGLILPKQYLSETTILVDPQKIPTEYVKTAEVGDITDRLQTIKEEVMSRTRLKTIAEQLGLYQDVRQKAGMDEVIDRMQKDITVEIIKGANDRSPIDGFKISYVASTPQVAQKVTQRISELFIQENLKARDRQAQGTHQFLTDELQKAKAQLDAQEEKIRAFKSAHLGSLPEQEGSNLSLISQYQSLAQANSEAIDRANQQRVYLQSMLNVNSDGKGVELPQVMSPTEVELQQKQEELAAAEQKYTDSYPDVIRLKAELASLELAEHQNPKGKPARMSASGPTTSQQLQGQLLAMQQEIKSRTARQARIEAQLMAIQGRVEMLPGVQGEFEDLNRTYQEEQKNYESLVENEQASGMATELDRHDDSESFRILDRANLPVVPSAPNLLVIDAGGIFAGLIVGLLLGIIVDMKDATIHTAEEVEQYLDLPLIVALPHITAEMNAVSAARTKKLELAT